MAGVNVDAESKRILPGGDTGRSVIGRTDIDGVGIGGLELQFDDLLTGTDGRLEREVAPGGRSIAGSETVSVPPVAGDDLVLTLDRSIQFATEQALLGRVNALGARGGTGIVMDTDTGEIYAMASVRRNDDTGTVEITSGNFAAVDAYEPGSVAKVITVAAALNEGAVTPDTVFNVPWRELWGDDLLADAEPHPDEWLTVAQILVKSSNIGTIHIHQTIRRQKHWEYMRAFGLGEATALGVPGRVPGHHEALEGHVGIGARHGGLRPGRLEHVDPAGGRDQRDRQRRYVRRAQARPLDRRARRHGDRHPAIGDPRGRRRGDRRGDAAADEAGRLRGHRRTGPGQGLRRRRQDRHRIQGPTRRHVLRRGRQPRATTRASSGSSRPTTRR